MTNISIINRTTKGVKVGLVSPTMFADEAVLIPAMLNSLPYPVFATSSIDAMVHAVESYLSPNACALSELFSEKALHLILSCWKDAVQKGGKDAWKEHALEFLRASNYAGIASVTQAARQFMRWRIRSAACTTFRTDRQIS